MNKILKNKKKEFWELAVKQKALGGNWCLLRAASAMRFVPPCQKDTMIGNERFAEMFFVEELKNLGCRIACDCDFFVSIKFSSSSSRTPF